MIKYPNGKTYISTNTVNNKPKNKKACLTSANRGMGLEHDINLSNDYYKAKDIALITKRPTPINVVKVDYTKGAKITDAYFEKQSTTDYNGVYNGKYIDFEAKSTKKKTSFPLANISKHQIEHLKNVIKHKGIAFFIIEFASFDEVYFLDAQYVINYYENGSRKSIPYQTIKEVGKAIKKGFMPRLDYLPIIKEICEKS